MSQRTVKDWTQVIPFANATDTQTHLAQALSLITAWNGALNGHMPLSDVLAVIARQVNASNITIYRHDGKKAWTVAAARASHDLRKPETSGGQILDYLRETQLTLLTPGSIWPLSELRQDEAFEKSSAAKQWSFRDDVAEVNTTILEHNNTHTDVVEALYETRPSENSEIPRTLLTQALAEGWALRSLGLVSALIRSFGRERARKAELSGTTILSADNPCALSRAEQRVANLLAAGNTARDISEALSLSITTVRSHLRNIYAKTETSGQVEFISLVNELDGLSGNTTNSD